MPKYQVTGPDGKSYEVNAPKGASQQDAIAYIAQTQYKMAAPEPAPAPTPAPKPVAPEEEEGFFTEVGKSLVRGTGNAVGALGGKALEEMPDWVASGMKQIPTNPFLQVGNLPEAAAAWARKNFWDEASAAPAQAIRGAGEAVSSSVRPRTGPMTVEEGYADAGILGGLRSAAITGAESLPVMAAAIGTGAATRSPLAAGAVMTAGYAPQEYEGIRELQAETGRGGVDEAVAGTMAIMALDTLTGLGGKVLKGISRDAAKEVIQRGFIAASKEVGKTGLKEGGTEAIQQVISQVAGGADPTTKEALKQTFEAAVVGAVTGTAVGGAMEPVTRGLSRRAESKALDEEGFTEDAAQQIQKQVRFEFDQAVSDFIQANPEATVDEATLEVQKQAPEIFKRAQDAVAARVATGVPPQVPESGAGVPVGPAAAQQPQPTSDEGLGAGVPVTGAGRVGQPDTTIAGEADRAGLVDDRITAGVDTRGTQPDPAQLALPFEAPVAAPVEAAPVTPAVAPIVAPAAAPTEDRRAQIKAATATLDNVGKGDIGSVAPFPDTEPDYYRFRHVTKDGKEVKGSYTFSDGVIDNFSIGSSGGSNTVGKGAIIRMAKLLQAKHPDATMLKAFRRDTGARDKEDFISIPLKAKTPAKADYYAGLPSLGTDSEAIKAMLRGIKQQTFVDKSGNITSIIAQGDGKFEVETRGKKKQTNQPLGQMANRIKVRGMRPVPITTDGTAVPPLVQPAPAPVEAAPAPVENIPSEAPPAPTDPIQVAQLLMQDAPAAATEMGFEGPTASMFSLGVEDVIKGAAPLSRGEIEAKQGKNYADAYQAAQDWARDRLTNLEPAAKATPVEAAAPATRGGAFKNKKAAPTEAAPKAKTSTRGGAFKAKPTAAKGKTKELAKTIKSKPGKSVQEKIYNLALTEVEDAPAVDIESEAASVTPYESEYETIRAKPGVNAKRMATMLGAQLYGNPKNMGMVTIKEILQNSVDAVRTAVNSGRVAQGKIDIVVSADQRTVTFTDNGTGMAPEVLGGKFLEVAGTDKEGSKNSGGFGIAKMLFLYANKNIEVTTARDGKVSTLSTTGEQLFAALEDQNNAPDIQVEDFDNFPNSATLFPDGQGTIISLTIPEKVPVADGEQVINELPIYVDNIESLRRSPLFANIAVSFGREGRTYSTPTETGVNFPIADYKQFVGATFPWGTAKIYVTREPTGQTYGSNMHFLSNGLWQFSGKVSQDPSNPYSNALPYTFYVDIIPSVKPDQPGYPFDFNRQGLTADAQNDFGQVKKYVNAIYAFKNHESSAKSFGTVQYLDLYGNTLQPPIELLPETFEARPDITGVVNEGDVVAVNEDGVMTVNGEVVPDLTPEELAAALPDPKDLKIAEGIARNDRVMVHDNIGVTARDGSGETTSLVEHMQEKFGERFNDLLDYVGHTFLDLRGNVAQIMGYKELAGESIGIAFDTTYRGVSIRLPFSASFINPLVPNGDTPKQMGYGIWGTMIHELAHHKERSHRAEFPAEMQKLMYTLEADLGDMTGVEYDQIKKDFAETIAAEYADIITYGKDLFDKGSKYGDGELVLENRGGGFEDSQEGIGPSGRGVGDYGRDDDASGAGSAGEPVLGPTYEGAGESDPDAGRGDDAGVGGESTEGLRKKLNITEAQYKRFEEAAGIRSRKATVIQKRIARTNRANVIANAQIELGKVLRGEKENLGQLFAIWDTFSDTTKGLMLQTLPTVDVLRLAKGRLKGLTDVNKIMTHDMREFDVLENERLADELTAMSRAFKRNPKMVQTLMDAMVIAVAAQVDPTLAPNAVEYAQKHDAKWIELNGKVQAGDTQFKPALSARLKAIERVYQGGEVFDDTANNGEGAGIGQEIGGWNKLNADAKRVFVTMKKAHERDLKMHYKALEKRLTDTASSPEALKEGLAALRRQFRGADQSVIYFPIMRHGEYFARVGVGADSTFSMFDTKTAMNKYIRAMGRENITDSGDTEKLRNKVRSEDKGLAEVLKLIDEGSEVNKESLRRDVTDLFLKTVPGHSMTARFAKRNLRAGYSTDVLRNFMAARKSNINARKAAKFGYKLDQAFKRANKESEGDYDNQQSNDRFIKEIKFRVEAETSPPNTSIWGFDKIAAMGNKAAFFWYLANPKSAFIQLTQMHLVSLPVMADKYGSAQSVAGLTKYGFSGLGGLLASPLKSFQRGPNGEVEFEYQQPQMIDNAFINAVNKSDPALAEAMTFGWEYAQSLNVFMETFASQIADGGQTGAGLVGEGTGLTQRPLGSTVGAVRAVASSMASTFHQMERVNREATFMASMELEYKANIKKGMDQEAAIEAAQEDAVAMTMETTFDFSAYNKPRIMTNKVGRLATQFWMYPISMTSILGRKTYGGVRESYEAGKAAFAGDPAGAKAHLKQSAKEARIAAGMLLNIGMWAGATGIPLYGLGVIVGDLFLAAFGDDDDFMTEVGDIGPATDMDYWFRNVWIPEFFGPDGTVADVLGLTEAQANMLALAAEKGPISAFTDIDLSSSVALDLAFFLPEESRADTPELAAAEKTFNVMTGAAGGVALDVIKGGWLGMFEGEWMRALEKAPRLVGNGVKAMRFAGEGQNTLTGAQVGLPKEFFTNDKTFGLFLGFGSTTAGKELSSGYGLKTATREIQEANSAVLSGMRKLAREELREGITSGSGEDHNKVLEQAMQFNDRYPQYAITSDDLLKAYQTAMDDIVDSQTFSGVPEAEDTTAGLLELDRRESRARAREE